MQSVNAIEDAKKLINEKEYGPAQMVLEGVLSGDDKNVFALFELGKINQIRGKNRESETLYKKVTMLDPGFWLAHLELGRLYYRQRRMQEARAAYERVIALDPENLDALKESAKLYVDLHEPRQALCTIKKAEALAAHDVEALFELGRSYRELGDDESSESVFKKILAFDSVRSDQFMHNKALNELEISQRKEALESKPRSLIAMILEKCNIRCSICEIWRGNWQVRDSVLNEIIGWFPYLEEINWQGGEVFMMKGFDDVIAEGARHKNLRQIIFTNGLMINEKILGKLEHGNFDIVFSIDAVDKETYEKIRFGGKFDKLLRVLALVKEFRKSRNNKISIYFNPVIMRSNYTQLVDFVEFAHAYDFTAVTFTPIRMYPKENIFDARDTNALEHIRKLMPEAMRRAHEYGVRLNNWLPLEQETGMPKGAEKTEDARATEGNAAVKKPMICYAPWQRLCLDCEGMVRPLGICKDISVGNTDTMSLAEIWNGEGMRNYRRKLAHNNVDGLCQPECIAGTVRDKTCKIN